MHSLTTGVIQPPDDTHEIKLRFPEQKVHFLHLKVITFNKLQRARAVELKTIGFVVIRKTPSDDCGTVLKEMLRDGGSSSWLIPQLEHVEIHN